MTQDLVRAGFRCRAVWPERALQTEPGTAASTAALAQAARVRAKQATSFGLHPSCDLWRPLIEAGFPFLKRDLLHGNPTEVADIGEWREVVSAVPGAEIGPIERALAQARQSAT